MALTEILLGATVVVASATAYAASLRKAGFAPASPYLAVALGGAAWFVDRAGLPAVPHLLVGAAACALAIGFLGTEESFDARVSA